MFSFFFCRYFCVTFRYYVVGIDDKTNVDAYSKTRMRNAPLLVSNC
jgi:hypothetical protein